MEEKHLLKEITYLSRLIGQHKYNIQPKDQHSYISHESTSARRQYSLNRSKMSSAAQNSTTRRMSSLINQYPGNNSHANVIHYPMNRSKINNVQYSTNNSKINVVSSRGEISNMIKSPLNHQKVNVVQHSMYKKIGADVAATTKQTVTKFRKKNTKDDKMILPVNDQRECTRPIYSNSLPDVPDQLKTVSIAFQQKSKLESSHLICAKPVVGLDTTSLGSNENASVLFSRVHINPHFLNVKLLCNELNVETTSKTNSRPSPTPVQGSTIVHVNPKVFTQLMTSKNEGMSNNKNEKACGNDKGSFVETKEMELNTLCEKSYATVDLLKLGNATASKGKHSFCSKRKLVNEHTRTSLPNSENIPKNNTVLSSTETVLVPTVQVSKKLTHTPQVGALMAVSRTKLVRVPDRNKRSIGSKSSPEINRKPSLVSVGSPSVNVNKILRRNISKFKYSCPTRIRRVSFTSAVSPSVKIAKAVCSKYKIRNLPFNQSIRRVSVPINKFMLCPSSKYKIDRRNYKILKRLKKVKKYSVKYENIKRSSAVRKSGIVKNKNQISPINGFSFTNKVWSNTGFSQPRKIVISQRKLSRIGTCTNSKARKIEENSSLVRIGGVLYKTSRTKLTRSKNSLPNTTQHKLSTVVRKRKHNSGHIVYVRGSKFIMDPLGKTLKRISNGDSRSTDGQQGAEERRFTQIKRIDIGGVTFVQKSSDILMRTNTHNTRNLLSQAKQKSIALLTKRMRKNNQPCMFYHRFGKCPRHEKGTCQHLHDPKQIAVCKKFLQGQCDVTGCLMSHDVVPEKMPTCRFFLEGCCVRDNCPYLHVKVNAKAVICRNFLQGYCTDGPRCKKRHVYLCPEFEQKGACRKGKYCPYPHKANVETNKTISKNVKRLRKEPINEVANLEPEKKRYYETKSDMDTNNISYVDNTPEFNPLKKVELIDQPLKGMSSEESSSNSSAHSCRSPHYEEDLDNETKPKRPKLGWLPSYIALDSDRDHSDKEETL